MVGHKQNGDPIFRYVLAKTQKELLAKLHRDMDLYQDAQLTEDSRMTLGDYLDRWMEEYVRCCHPASQHPAQLRAVHPMLREALLRRQDHLPHHPSGYPEAVPEAEKRGPGPRPSGVRVRAVGHYGAPHPRHAPPVSQRRGTGSHHPLQPHGRNQATQEQLQAQAGPGPGADGRLPGGSGQERNLAGLLLHGTDHRPAPG